MNTLECANAQVTADVCRANLPRLECGPESAYICAPVRRSKGIFSLSKTISYRFQRRISTRFLLRYEQAASGLRSRRRPSAPEDRFLGSTPLFFSVHSRFCLAFPQRSAYLKTSSAGIVLSKP